MLEQIDFFVFNREVETQIFGRRQDVSPWLEQLLPGRQPAKRDKYRDIYRTMQDEAIDVSIMLYLAQPQPAASGGAMAAAFKTCPICMTANARSAERCHNCGGDLSKIALDKGDPETTKLSYSFERGETDFLEESVAGRTLIRTLGALIAVITLGIVAMIGVFAVITLRRVEAEPVATHTPVSQPVLVLVTVTPSRPTSTHTPWPSATPLPSPTPSPAPCIQKVRAGDTLIALVTRCGHRHRDIVSVVVDQNGLISAERLQIGQEIIIPWPTATPYEGEAAIEPTSLSAFVIPTSTLPAGVMWHRVSLGENIVYIASKYGANLEIMSQLNPEVSFSQCDFGLVYGGDSCIVQIVEGQQLRVPEPTALPSATLQPVFALRSTESSPRENIPYSLRPGNGVVYRADEIVTLRWLSSGTLEPDQIFVVEVIDETATQRYLAETRDAVLRLPDSWQGVDGQRHVFRWRVGLRTGDADGKTIWTEARTFIWLAHAAGA